jgi:hypothetical protein
MPNHSKSHGQRQQQAGVKSGSQALPSQVTNEPTKRLRPPPKERTASNASSPSTPAKSPKKTWTAPSQNPGQLAAVEALEETSAVTGVNVPPPTSIDSVPTTAAPVPIVNVSSSGASITDEEQNLIELHESSSIPKQWKDKDAGKKASESDNSDSSRNDAQAGETQLKKRKGKDKDAGKNATESGNSDSSSNDGHTGETQLKKRKGKDSDSSSNDGHTGETQLKKRKGKDKDAGKNAAGSNNSDSSSNDGDSDDGVIFPTPVKKQSGIERLQRGRKIKAVSPGHVPNPYLFC